MPTSRLLPLSLCALAAILLGACATESISSEYSAPSPRGRARASNDSYAAGFMGHELSEADLVGVSSGEGVTEEEIATAAAKRTFALHEGGRVLLVQSGAPVPDKEMMDAFSAHYTVIPMDGFRTDSVGGRLDRAFRLSAAKGGVNTIVVVWGVLESAQKGNAASAVSWVPVVGSLLPAQTKIVRIRLRALVIDVNSGSWDFVVPETFSSDVTTSAVRSEYNFAVQKLELKTKAYQALATALAERFK